jgi:hypothetical protein
MIRDIDRAHLGRALDVLGRIILAIITLIELRLPALAGLGIGC